VRTKLEYLRLQAEAYWRDVDNAKTEAEALQLLTLAARCQEQILEIEFGWSAPKTTLH